MISAVAAQWLVLRRRPMLKVLLAVYVLLMALQFFAPIGLVRLAPQLESLGAGNALNDATIAALQQTVQLPSAWATIFGQVNGIGGLLLLILAASFVGSDYQWGLSRGLLARDPRRGRYLLAKLLALVLLAGALVLLSLPLGMLCAWSASAALGLPFQSGLAVWPDVLRGALIAWLGLWPYLALATMCGTLGRSAATGIAATLGYWLLEIGLGFISVFQMLGALGQFLYTFSLAQSVGAWTEETRRAFNLELGQTFGQVGVVFPDLLRATLQLLLYTVIFLLLAWWSLRRRDLRA